MFSFNENEDKGKIVSTQMECTLHDEVYLYGFKYYENTGEIIGQGGNAYLYNVLDLEKYDDGRQVVDIIDAYIKNNGGICEINTEYYEENN